MKTRVTVASITEDLDRITAGAEASDQWGAARGAVETKAKLHGLLVDRKESGAPGDFAQAQTPDAILELVAAELGPETAAALRAALGREDAAQVEPEVAVVVERGADDALN